MDRVLNDLALDDRIVFQAVIMILGHHYLYDHSFHIVFSKASTIGTIKSMTHCKLDKVRVQQIRRWMNCRKLVFITTSRIPGLTTALIEWCKLMVSKRNPLIKELFSASSTKNVEKHVNPTAG